MVGQVELLCTEHSCSALVFYLSMLSLGRQEGCKVVDPPGVGRDVKDCKRQRTNWSIFISLPNKNKQVNTTHVYTST